MSGARRHRFIKSVIVVSLIGLPIVLWQSPLFVRQSKDTRVTVPVNAPLLASTEGASKKVQIVSNNIDIDMRDFHQLYEDDFYRDLLLDGHIAVAAPVVLENENQSTPFYEWQDGIRKSFFHFINKDVYKGEKTIGQVADILVQRYHPELDGLAGTALYLVYQNGKRDANNDMVYRIIPFDDVSEQHDDDTFLVVVGDEEQSHEIFHYSDLARHPDLISLKKLQGGRALDTQGRHIGDIYAVTYDEALAQEVIIRLDKAVFNLPENKNFFAIPFTEIDLRPHYQSVDILLTQAQVAAITSEVLIKEQ